MADPKTTPPDLSLQTNPPPDPDPAPAPAPMPPMQPQTIVMESGDQRAQREMAQAARDAAERDITTTQPGGRYLVGADAQGKGGTLVDFEGKPVKDKKD